MSSIPIIKEDTKMMSTILESSGSPVLITERTDFTQGIDFITNQGCVQNPAQNPVQ